MIACGKKEEVEVIPPYKIVVVCTCILKFLHSDPPVEGCKYCVVVCGYPHSDKLMHPITSDTLSFIGQPNYCSKGEPWIPILSMYMMWYFEVVLMCNTRLRGRLGHVLMIMVWEKNMHLCNLNPRWKMSSRHPRPQGYIYVDVYATFSV
jgi:hypothetical protein